MMVPSHALVVLSLTLASADTAARNGSRPNRQPHVCDPNAPGGCTVCNACCRFGGNQTKCDACFAIECTFDCKDAAEACSEQCVRHCWSELTSTPCLRECVSCHGVWLLLGVLVPYFGRLVIDFLLGEVKKRCRRRFACCRPKARVADRPRRPDDARLDQPLVGREEEEVPGFTMAQLMDADGLRMGNSWADAVEATGLSSFGAAVRGTGRCLFWHVAQPAGYFAVYGCAISVGELDDLQVVLGGFVAAREVLYLLFVGACVWVRPAFLLVDVGASLHTVGDDLGHGGYGFLAMYVFAPEKFVAIVLFGTQTSKILAVMIFGVVLDLFAVGALAWAIDHPPPLALTVGYGVTTLAIVSFICLWIHMGMSALCSSFEFECFLCECLRIAR